MVRRAWRISSGVKRPRNTPCSGKCIADGKGVCREAESEGSRRRTPGLTNRNRIRRIVVGKAAKYVEVPVAVRSHGRKCGRRMGGKRCVLPREASQEPRREKGFRRTHPRMVDG